MQHAATDHAISRAGTLIQHWNARDLPSLIPAIADIRTLEEAHDVIAALLALRIVPDSKLPGLIFRTEN